MTSTSWTTIVINDRRFLISFELKCSGSLGYKFILSDLKTSYLENMDTEEECKQRFASTNPDLEEFDIEEGLDELKIAVSKEWNKSKFSLQMEGETKELKVEWSSDGIPFAWNFRLRLMNVEETFHIFNFPFLSSIHHLLEERNNLVKIIRDKDLEIEDYVCQGATLSLPQLKTVKFKDEDILNKVNYKTLEDSDAIDFFAGDSVQALMKEVKNVSKNDDPEKIDEVDMNNSNNSDLSAKVKGLKTPQNPELKYKEVSRKPDFLKQKDTNNTKKKSKKLKLNKL